MEKIDCLVIGAGVVGLAIARALALEGREVFLVEAEERIGQGISGRNSEVIHAGIYYPQNSLKASLCVAGNATLYQYCLERAVPHRKLGKLIVATNSQQEEVLKHYEKQGGSNNVDGLKLLSRQQLQDLEPALRGTAALYSSTTGIIDAQAFMKQLETDVIDSGSHLVFKSPVISGKLNGLKPQIQLGGISEMGLECNWVINSGGLAAPTIASALGQNEDTVPKQYYAKGHYFSYNQASPFRHLIYPVAVDGGLGIHLTLDMGGQARFGPDVQWLEQEDYSFDDSRKRSFIEHICHYYPALDEQALQPAYTGIRPKLRGPGGEFTDFMVQGERQHGCRGLINLFGIESPGLTSSLAIAEHTKTLIKQLDKKLS